MREVPLEEAGWMLARVWLTAMEQAARDFHGTRPWKFCNRAYEYATEEFLRVLEDEYGLRARKGTSIKEAVESYIELGVKAGLFKDASQFELKEVRPSKLEVKVALCPYVESCKDLLEKGFTLRDLTCPRIGCFRAAVKLLANIDCHSIVTGLQLGEGCEGVIERV
jgi:hypothetical protein